MTFPKKTIPPEIQAERDNVKSLLGLKSDMGQVQVIYGTVGDRDNVVAMHTRSGMQILREFASHVQVPEEHQREQRVYPHAKVSPEAQEALPPLMQILSSTSKPSDAFALVHYNDLWFWIDNRDLRSKGTMTFLLVLMTLADTGEKAPAPILTIPAN